MNFFIDQIELLKFEGSY